MTKPPRGIAAAKSNRRRASVSLWFLSLLAVLFAGVGTLVFVPELWDKVTAYVPSWSSGSTNTAWQTAPVAPIDLVVSVSELGEVESSSNVDVKCLVKGGSTILWIIPEGTEVEQDELLVKLDDSTLKQEHISQKILYETARSALIQAEQDLVVAKIALREYLEGTYEKELQVAQSNVVIANENLKTARNKLDHANKMFRKGYITRLQLESSEFAVQHAELDLAAQKTAERVLTEFTRPKMSTEMQATIDVSEAVMQSKKAAYELEEQKLKDLEHQITQCSIRAPKAGMVIYNNERGWRGNDQSQIEEGVAVREQQTLIKLPDLSRIQVDTAIHETKIQRVKIGQKAMVRIRNRDFAGKVIAVATQPEPTTFFGSGSKKYSTIVELVDYDKELGLRPGMTADVTIIIDEFDDLLAIPQLGLMQVGTNHYCFVETPDGPVRRDVVPGVNNGTMVEIKDGVAANERVILNPRASIPEAQRLSRQAEKEAATVAGQEGNKKRPQGAPGAPGGPGGPPNGAGPGYGPGAAPGRGPSPGGPAAPEPRPNPSLGADAPKTPAADTTTAVPDKAASAG